MSSDDFEASLLKRLDAIVKLLLEQTDPPVESTTEKVRWLHTQGFSTGEIANILNAKYNSVSGIIAKRRKKVSKGQKAND